MLLQLQDKIVNHVEGYEDFISLGRACEAHHSISHGNAPNHHLALLQRAMGLAGRQLPLLPACTMP